MTTKRTSGGAMTPIGILKLSDPKEWARQIKAAMKAAGGNRRVAAEKLGISWRQLMRYLEDPLVKDVAALKPNRAKVEK